MGSISYLISEFFHLKLGASRCLVLIMLPPRTGTGYSHCNFHCVGQLSAVGSLNITASDSTLSLTWEPPFTLDITGVDPDITCYCVDVVDSTYSVTLHSQCNITMTEFSYPLPQDAVCHSYVLTVSPVNVVGRGVSSSVSYIGTAAGTVSNHKLMKM